MAAIFKLIDTVPSIEMVTVRKGGRRSGKELGRDREYLTPEEVERLAKATKSNRNGNRDWLMIMMAYRHASVHGCGGDSARHRVCRIGVVGGGHRTSRLRWSCETSTLVERGSDDR
jgi:hypothetical protein